MQAGRAVSRSEAIERARGWYDSRQLKPRSVGYRNEMLKLAKETLPDKAPVSWTAVDMEQWWKSPRVSKLSANRRNNLLATVRKILELLELDNVTAQIQRVRVPKKELSVPSRKDFQRLVSDVRGQGKRVSEHVADMIEFLAYSGCRISEARAVTWGDIGEDFIRVTGGQDGTKNHEARSVPIIPAMNSLLETMNKGTKKQPLFSIRSPHQALRNACQRLELDHMRVHDLRHLFATSCIESGVDIPTVAKWLGHKDGGALAMKTYGHLRDDHSKRQASRVEF